METIQQVHKFSRNQGVNKENFDKLIQFKIIYDNITEKRARKIEKIAIDFCRNRNDDRINL